MAMPAIAGTFASMPSKTRDDLVININKRNIGTLQPFSKVPSGVLVTSYCQVRVT